MKYLEYPLPENYGMWLMLEFVAGENIKRFAHQLRTATDEAERTVLTKMLQDESENLEAIIGPSFERSGSIGRET